MGFKRINGIAGRRKHSIIRVFRPQLRRLDEAGTAWRPYATHIRWSGFSESVYRSVEKRSEQLRPRDRICVADALVRRRTDDDPRRLSSEFPSRPRLRYRW